MEREERAAAASGSHVFVLPFPIQGHINPMLQFSKRLAAKGLKITFITTTSMPGQGSSSSSSSIAVQPISDGLKEDERAATTPDEYTRIYKATVPKSLAELISRNPGVKCLIYDSIIPWALEVAQGLGIQGGPFFTQSCAVSAVYYHAIQGALGPVEELSAQSVVSLPSIPQLEFSDLPSLVHDAVSYPAIYDLVISQFSNLDDADWVFWNTFIDLEHEAAKWMASKWSIKPIGPTIPSMFLDKRLEDDKDYGVSFFKPNSDVCMKWLDSKEPRSVVYVSFGSLAALGEEQMAELAMALKSSNCHFLWVVRESEEKKLPPNFANEISSETGLIVRWSPQLEVLAHKSVGCFVTHCGWNSTLEALSLGVPMVAMPQWTDQPTNAKFVADVWRVGLKVKVNEKGMVTKEELADCIKKVMVGEEQGEEIRRNSEKLKELAKKAVDVGGSSDRNITEFVSELAGDQ